MKCRICGAKLRKDGDICKSCYEEYCKEEALEKDINEIYKLKGKYILSFQLTQYIDWILVTIFIVIALFVQQQYFMSIAFLLVAIVCVLVALYFAKKRAANTSCTFFEKKVVWKHNDRKKTIAYSDIKDVTYYQNFFQKIFKLYDIQFHPEGGTYLIGGFELKNVSNFDEIWPQIEQIIDLKKEK